MILVLVAGDVKMKEIRIFILTIKYWLKGDDWEFAKEYAEAIVRGFK